LLASHPQQDPGLGQAFLDIELACFLVEIRKTILDYIVALHDQLLTKQMREAKHAFEPHYQQVRRYYRRGLATLMTTGQTLLDLERLPDTTLAALLRELDAAALRDAVHTCEARHRLEERGEIDAFRARYPGLRRYLPSFFSSPFQGEPGSEVVLKGLNLIRQPDTGMRQTLSSWAPTAFVPRKLWPALAGANGTMDRRTWELGLAVAIRDGLRSGEFYLPEKGGPGEALWVARRGVPGHGGPRAAPRAVGSTGADRGLPASSHGAAHVVLQRLASSAPSDRLAKALTALGRALKSLYLLQYVHDLELRRRVQLQLNRGERRHQLARRLFFANQGAFQTGDYDEMMNKASCLSLLSNAVVVWNTVQMTRIIDQFRAGGDVITDDELARISPLAFAHVIPNGTYFARHVTVAHQGAHPGDGSALDMEEESGA
jgi:hypothetical protein